MAASSSMPRTPARRILAADRCDTAAAFPPRLRGLPHMAFHQTQVFLCGGIPAARRAFDTEPGGAYRQAARSDHSGNPLSRGWSNPGPTSTSKPAGKMSRPGILISICMQSGHRPHRRSRQPAHSMFHDERCSHSSAPDSCSLTSARRTASAFAESLSPRRRRSPVSIVFQSSGKVACWMPEAGSLLVAQTASRPGLAAGKPTIAPLTRSGSPWAPVHMRSHRHHPRCATARLSFASPSLPRRTPARYGAWPAPA